MTSVAPETVEQFLAFIEASKLVMPPDDTPLPVADFLKLVSEARPLLLRGLRESVCTHRDRLKHLTDWLIPNSPDLLSTAGLAGLEDPYTELLAWALYPPAQPSLALLLQKAWLHSLGIADAIQMTKPVAPSTQFDTDDGIADLVLHCSEVGFLVIVEAKVDSVEHETPSGQMQTVAYPIAVRRRLGLRPSYSTHMVFLTTDGTAAANQQAVLATYEGFAVALASQVRPRDIGADDIRWAYATIFTHLLSEATSDRVDAVGPLRAMAHFLGGSGETADEEIMANFEAFALVARLTQ